MNDTSTVKPKVVFIGHVVIDHNKVEQASYVRWGSPAMFMMRYFRSNVGINPTIIASYGKDFLEYARDVHLLPQEPNLEHTIVYENIYINGRRTLYCHFADAELPVINPDIEHALSDADIVVLAPLTPAYSKDYVARLMALVRPDCLKVLLPQGYFRHISDDGLVWPREFMRAADILPYFDLAIISNEDHLDADKLTHEWKRLSPKTDIIVTRNAEGADIILDKGVKHIPTTPVPADKIVDPVGLGDVFSAATAYELYRTGDLTAAVKDGHIAAREKLMSPRVI